MLRHLVKIIEKFLECTALNLEIPAVSLCTNGFNVHHFYVLPTQFICVFCVDLRTNSDYFPVQHLLTGFYIGDEVCLLRGME